MKRLLNLFIHLIHASAKSRNDLILENIALRQQLAIFKHKNPRPKTRNLDRIFWILLKRFWSGWQNCLHIVSPDTVKHWHRNGFKMYWRWKSRAKRLGRPKISKEIRDLIKRMAADNPTWRAPRIHGELLMLGFDVSEATVSRYLPKRKPTEKQLKQWITCCGSR